jgi:tetratricopeptide (TPR) repeat protein
MPARASLLVLLLSSACAAAEPQTPEAQAPAAGPQILESAAPSTELAPPSGPDAPPPTPKPAEQPPPPAAAPASPLDLAPRISGASGPDADKYFRAESHRSQGDPQGMREALVELVRDHPNSPFMPHAYLMLGEELFRRGEMKSALQTFEKTLMYPADDTGAYAQYMIGWCHMNLGDSAESLGAFVKSAERAQRVQTESGKALARASVLDSALPYAHVGKLAAATNFYKRVTTGSTVTLDEVLRRVARAALDMGRRDELLRVCESEGMPGWCAGPLDQP